MYKFLSVVLSLLISVNGYSDTLESKEHAKKLAENVMLEIARGGMEAGVLLTEPYLIVPKHEFDALQDNMKMQEPAIRQRFGETIGIELAEIEEVGESLMLIMYLQKFEKHVLRWKFYFYKPKEHWILNTFMFDDHIQSMFVNS